jgi:hypothetical protein
MLLAGAIADADHPAGCAGHAERHLSTPQQRHDYTVDPSEQIVTSTALP